MGSYFYLTGIHNSLIIRKFGNTTEHTAICSNVFFVSEQRNRLLLNVLPRPPSSLLFAQIIINLRFPFFFHCLFSICQGVLGATGSAARMALNVEKGG